jgi:membrane protease YdiL (CAAX protease family)
MADSTTTPVASPWQDVWLFFALACALTWLLDLPFALALIRRVPPAPYALPLAGFGSLGPTLAALVVAARRRELRDVFGRWRTNPAWIVGALLVPLALHLPATLLEVALGGQPAQWFYPPVRPEHFAAMIMFAVGEEFGWRGYAYPRLVRRHGPVVGCLILGVVWAVWHLLMTLSPETGRLDLLKMGMMLVDMPLYCLVFAWVFERANRSMAVAIALHAGAHADNVYRAPTTEVRLMLLRFLVLAVVAALAARALTRRAGGSAPRA